MSEEMNNQPHALEHNDFEREDLSPGGVMYFLVGLAVVGIVIYFIVYGLYNFLDRYEREHQAVVSPLLVPNAEPRKVTHEDTLTFPQPRLEENERTQLKDIIEEQDNKLATYDWVDKDKGVVRIPIDRAMDLVAERGLPVRSENNASAAAQKNQAPPQSAAASTGVSQ